MQGQPCSVPPPLGSSRSRRSLLGAGTTALPSPAHSAPSVVTHTHTHTHTQCTCANTCTLYIEAQTCSHQFGTGPKTGHLVSLPTICIHFNMADQVEPTRYRGAHICMRLTSTSAGDSPWWWVHTTSSSHTLPHTACCPSLGRAHSSVFGGLPPPGLEGEDNRALLRRLGTTLRRAVEWSNDP